MSKGSPKPVPFGEWLRTRRRMLDLTQQEFADEVGCARITLRRIEAGALKPSRELAQAFLDRLGIPAGEQEAWILFARGLSPLPGETGPVSVLPPPTNLPHVPTSFIGREKELGEAAALIEQYPLLTLTGPGGIGKTRFSIQVAQRLLNVFPDGVWMVEFAPIHEPQLVPRVTAAALGLRDEVQRPVIDMLCDYVRSRSMLIILDNCEHLVAACAQMADRLLRAGAHVRLLASSREGLNIPGEVTYPLPPLALPAPDQSITAGVIGEVEAARLFIDRATSALATFTVSDGNAAAIARICRRLDGIPLAIELAASKVRVLSPEQIEQRLDDRFRLLTGGSRTTLERHQTLRAAIDWSYHLLSDEEQALFRRLAVFVRSWSLEAAEAVCAGELVPQTDVLPLLEQLINKSMILTEQAHGELRYHMLETMRQYAYEKLLEAGELDALSDRHLDHFLRLAETAAVHLLRSEQLQWLERLDAETENLRAALTWSLGQDSPEPALRLCAALGRYWLVRGSWKEGSWWLEGALSKPSTAQPGPGERAARLRALYTDADLADHLGDLNRMEASARAGLDLCGPETDRRDAAIARFYLGLVFQGREDNESALRCFEQSLAEFHALDEPYWEACAFRSLTYILVQRGEMARELRDAQNLALARRAGERLHLAKVLFNQAAWSWTSQRTDEAEQYLRESESLYEQLGYKTGKVLYYRAVLAHLNKDYDEAKILYDRVKEQSAFLGDRDRQSLAITNLGVLTREQGDLPAARTHIEEALRIAGETGSKHDTGYRLALLSEVEYLQGDVPSAKKDLLRSLSIAGELTDRRYTIGNTLLIFANIFIHLRPETAVRVFGATHAYLQQVDEHLDRFFLRDSDRVLQQAHQVLDDRAFEEAFSAGQKLSLSEALQLAWQAVDEM